MHFRTRNSSNAQLIAMTINGNQNVGIGITTPDAFYTHAKNLVIGSGSGGEGITIFSGTSDSGYIGFNDTVSNSMQGYIQYNHNGDYMAFGPNGTEKLRITSGGDLLLGNHGSRIFDDSSGTNVVVDIYGGTVSYTHLTLPTNC